MFDAHAYTILVKKLLVDDEQLYKAAVKELPHVDVYSDSYQEAYESCIDAIETLHEMAQERGEGFPTPIQEEEDFSGRVTLRMPKTIHRQIAALAETEGVSLNQYIVTVLSRQVGLTTSLTREISAVAAIVMPDIYQKFAATRSILFKIKTSSEQLEHPKGFPPDVGIWKELERKKLGVQGDV